MEKEGGSGSGKSKETGGDERYARQRRYQKKRYESDADFKNSMIERVVAQRKENMKGDQEYKEALYKRHAEYTSARYKSDPGFAEKKRSQSREYYYRKKDLVEREAVIQQKLDALKLSMAEQQQLLALA
jgi:hypothetical protein